MSADHYVIRGGLAGRERLRVLARVTWLTTSPLLERGGRRVVLLPRHGVWRRRRDGGSGAIGAGRIRVGADIDEPQLDIARREAAEQVSRTSTTGSST